MKCINKISLIFLIIIIFISNLNFVNAAGDYTINPSPILEENSQEFRDMVGRLIGLIKWTSIIGAVIMITFLGVKYMVGSLEEKAQYKKSMVPWVVGTAIVAISSTIVDFIYNTLTF